MKKTMLAITFCCLLAGCGLAPAKTIVRSVDSRPSLAVTNAPAAAILFVDGLNMGSADQYDGAPNVLILEPGTHRIELKAGDAVIYKQSIFVESGLKSINIH